MKKKMKAVVSEIFTRKGLSPGVHFPRILGIECTGTIAVSSDERRLPPGQKVISIMGEMGRAFDGSYAEYVLLPNKQVYPVEIEEYRIDISPARNFIGLDQVAEAHRYLESPGSFGKTVVRIPD
ncbi:MAG: alcohol dehydrogenase catalytic domain-containing protein [Bilifractor sp.]|jgi:threonine dehydrogenase-like Zn-dependent dehydrogenase